MEGLDYYKSLVTDEEVINALLKESKAREGELEKSRIRPNIQFFQRTVSNLVSSNNRITVNQEKLIAKEKEKNKICRPKKFPVRKKMPIDYIKEILSNTIQFVKSTEGNKSNNESKTSAISETSNVRVRPKKTLICKKTPFQQIREILTSNVDKNQPKSSTSTSTEKIETITLKNRTEIIPEIDVSLVKLTNFKKRQSSDTEDKEELNADNKYTEVVTKTKKCKKRKHSKSDRKLKINLSINNKNINNTSSLKYKKPKKRKHNECGTIYVSDNSMSTSNTGTDSESDIKE